MQDTPKMIIAQEFVLVDEEGSPRANLAMDDGGQAALTFFSRDGDPKLLIGVGKNGVPVINLTGPGLVPTAFITIDLAGTFKVAFLDKNGDNRFQLTADSSGASVVIGIGGNPPNVLISSIDGKGSVETL